jgi:hypothetical protein
MSTEQELRRCPFCNATPHKGATKVQHDQLHGEPFQRYRIWCPHGCANIERMNDEQAREAWNGSDLADDKAAWQWSDSSGKWYTVDTAFATLEEQEELARRVAGQHEGRVRPLFARRSSDEQAEVVGWRGRYRSEEKWKYFDHPFDGFDPDKYQLEPLYASPPAVAAGGVTDTERLARECLADFYRSNGDNDMAADVVADDWERRSSPGETGLIKAIKRALTAALAVGDEGIREPEAALRQIRAMFEVHHFPSGNSRTDLKGSISDIVAICDAALPTPPSRGEGE